MAQVSYGTITITDTNDIESIVVEYNRNQSTTTPPTQTDSGWSTNRPAWAQGYYIWQRTRTHKSETSTSEDVFGNAVCITGSTGQTGATGQSLSSTKTQYTNAASNVTITTSNHTSYTWTDNVPAYNSSKPVYWCRVTNTYINPSKTEYIVYKDQGTTDAIKTSNDANTTAAAANSTANEAKGIAQQASTDVANLQTRTKYFWTNLVAHTKGSGGWTKPDYPVGTFAASGISGTTFDYENSSTYGYNTLYSNGIKLRYNAINLGELTGSSLTFYRPSTTSQGSKGMELTSSALKFYDATGTVAQATFGGTQATISGTINVYDGKIGNNANNYWYIGNYTDYNQNTSAIIKSKGTASIQLDETNTWRISTNRIHTSWAPETGTDAFKLHFPKFNDSSSVSKYWDYGLHLPTSYGDKFLYIRNASGSETLDNLLNDLDDSGYNYWNYKFYIDGEGNIHAGDIYSHDTLISGTSAPYLLKSGGTITGNLEVNGTLTKGGKTVTYLTSTPTSGQILIADGTSGSIKTSGYTIAKSVPSNAVFTDQYVQTVLDNSKKLYLTGTQHSGTYTGTLNYNANVYVEGDALNASTILADSAQLGDLIVTGAGRFANGLYGDLIGNADTATKAAKVADSHNGADITLNYSGTNYSTTSWFAAWNGYQLGAISPSNVLKTIGADKSASISDRINITGTGNNYNWVSSTNDDKLITSNTLAFWNGAYNSSNHASNIEYVKAGKLGDIVTHNASEFVTTSGNAASATKATQDGNGNTISSTYLKLSGGTLTKADGVSYTVANGESIRANPTSIIQSPIPKYLWHDVLAFCKIGVPNYYTTSNGTTWTASTLEKNIFANMENWGEKDVLDSNVNGSRWEWINVGLYASQISWLVLGITYASPIAHFDVLIETSEDSGSTWTTLSSSTNLYYSANPIWIKVNGTCQNSIRITLTRNSDSSDNYRLPICSMKLLTSRWGNQGKGSELEYPYTWDGDGNITATGTFTGTFNGNATSATSATSASKLNSTRSFTVGNTAKNVDWSGAVSFTKAEISDDASSTTNGWMSVADKKKLDSITVSDIGTIGANSIRGEKDIKVTISSGIATIGHENAAITAGTISGTATSTLSNGGSFKIPSITYDAYGHITGTAQTTITLPNITSVSGNAGTATKFSSARAISLSGDTTGTATADGSSGWSIGTLTSKLTPAADNRSVATTPNDYNGNSGLGKLIFQGLKANGYIDSPSTATYSYLIGLRGWADSSGGKAHELAFNDSGIFTRMGSTTTWDAWRPILDSSNFDDYALPLTGGTLTGDLIVGTTDSPANIQIGAKNDNYGLLPSVNNYNQIGKSGMSWYRAYISNYYGANSMVTNWRSGNNIGYPSTSSANAERGKVNFYNDCTAGSTQTKTLLEASASATSNITLTLPNKTGTIALTSDNVASATTATYSYYPKFVASNELRFDVNSKPSSAINLYVGYKWSDGTSDAKITRYNFYNGGTSLAEIRASTFYGDLSGHATSATKAAQDGSGNVITSTYVNLTGTQTISGAKTFSTMILSSAGICVNSGGSGTAGGVSLWQDKNVDQYGLALRTTANGGKHGFVQGDYATYNYMYASSDAASLTRGWVFKNNRVSKNVASIGAEGDAAFNGEVAIGTTGTDISGSVSLVMDHDLNCLNFIFN